MACFFGLGAITVMLLVIPDKKIEVFARAEASIKACGHCCPSLLKFALQSVMQKSMVK